MIHKFHCPVRDKIWVEMIHKFHCPVRDIIWVEMIHKFHCPVRDKIWVERQMHHLLRAVGTPYEMSDILRTYGTLYTDIPFSTHIRSLTG